jgi:hypothetical protein
MNSTRRNMLLAVVLGFLVLLDLGSAPDNRPARDVGPLLPQLDVQRAARIELLGTAGESLVLERGDLGWVLPGSLGYSARQELVRSLLASLASLSTLDLVSSDRDRHGEYGVAAGTHLRILDGSGTVLAELLQGGLAPDGKATYGRLLAEDKTYRLTGLAPLRLEKAYYLDARLLSFESALVGAIRLQNSEGSLRIVRDTARVKVWRREDTGQPVAAVEVENLLNTLRATFLEEVIAVDSLEELDSFHLELELAGGVTLGVTLGDPVDGGLVPAKTTGSEFTVGLSDASARALRTAAGKFGTSGF